MLAIIENHQLPPTYRLKTSKQFREVFDKNHAIHGNFWVLFYTQTNSSHHPRLGLAISKKVSPLAVKRNRLKRIVREFFRVHKDGMSNLDIVVIAKKISVQHCDNESEKLFDDLIHIKKKLNRRLSQ